MNAPKLGRVLALDPGEKRTGVSVSNSDRTLAFPRPAVVMNDHALEAITQVVLEEGATVVVIGLPKSLSGKEGAAAQSARRLAQDLEVRLGGTGILVELFDERLTTVQAASSLQAAGKSSREQRSSIDSAAATILLDAWMEAQ